MIFKNKNFFRNTACAFASDEDELPTEIGSGMNRSFDDEEETKVSGGAFRNGRMRPSLDDYAATELASRTYMERMDETLLDIPETGLLGLLWVVEGERMGRIYKIKDGDIVGKRDGALILDDPKISTPHCRFREENENFILWDCGSKNGTFVNNKRIREATRLEENDRIKVGDTVFSLKVMK
ncbi:MAG: FHA domain-containing protein [Anaerolineaceae bacterium]